MDSNILKFQNNPANGVKMPMWKVTFFLPTKISIATNNICHFTVQILGKKGDYGELPLIYLNLFLI